MTKGRATDSVLTLSFYGDNAETCMNVGLAMGEAMAKLFKAESPADLFQLKKP